MQPWRLHHVSATIFPMNEEEKALLLETVTLVKENNKMLKKVRSVQKWANFWLTIKALIFIGVALGSFYFLEPYINKTIDLYNKISGTTEKVNTTTNSLQDVLKKISI